MKRRAGGAAYEVPLVKDYGSLVELTRDFDLNFVGSAAKVLTMAAVSAPMPGGGRDLPDDGMRMPPGSETLDQPDASRPSPVEGGPGGGQEGGPRGDVLTEQESAIPTEGETPSEDPTHPAPGGTGGGTIPASEAGRLPFTGYVAWSWAAMGAAMTTAGVTLRQVLKRGG